MMQKAPLLLMIHTLVVTECVRERGRGKEHVCALLSQTEQSIRKIHSQVATTTVCVDSVHCSARTELSPWITFHFRKKTTTIWSLRDAHWETKRTCFVPHHEHLHCAIINDMRSHISPDTLCSWRVSAKSFARVRCEWNTTTRKMNGSNDNELWLNKVHIKIEFIKNVHVGRTNAVATENRFEYRTIFSWWTLVRAARSQSTNLLCYDVTADTCATRHTCTANK